MVAAPQSAAPESDAPEPATRRRGRPGTDSETVLRTAIALFNERGYDHTSMGDLAAALGLSKATVYHHVPSKQSLLAAALDEALAELSAAVRAPVGATAGERLRELIHHSVEILVDHQPAVTLLLRVHGNSEVEQQALVRRRALDADVAELVAAAIDEGALREDLDPGLVSRLLFGMINSLVEWWRPGGDLDAATLADAVTTLAFDGLRR